MYVSIKGKRWKVERLTPKQFIERYPITGVDVLALTEYSRVERTITFCGTPSYSTIKHEVMHAFLSSHSFAGVSYGQIEEQVCDEVGYNLERIERVAKLIRTGIRRKKL